VAYVEKQKRLQLVERLQAFGHAKPFARAV